MVAEGESKITPVLQMSQFELQELTKDCEQKVKSIVFKQVKKVSASKLNNQHFLKHSLIETMCPTEIWNCHS
jgi:hypothetical protein